MIDRLSCMEDLTALASVLVAQLRKAGWTDDLRPQQTLCVAEEAGGTLDEVRAELADVVITSFVAAEVFGIDLTEAIDAKLQVVFSRGWREERP